ncbi:MAG: 6,7-dimethyl-8-ribityllumazine synthase [Nitrosopumilaceae archaeon]
MLNIAIVTADFNQEVTSKMLNVAVEKAKNLKLNIKFTCKVPGIFDMPIVIDALLQKKEVDAVVTLGAVIKGETKHDELIANAVAKSLIDLAIKYKKPVTLGITGPGMTERQAQARIKPVTERAVEAVMKISDQMGKII